MMEQFAGFCIMLAPLVILLLFGEMVVMWWEKAEKKKSRPLARTTIRKTSYQIHYNTTKRIGQLR